MSTLFKKIKKIQIKASKRVTEVLSGAYSSSFKGSGIVFDDVREYVFGDEVRNIDWKLTAKMQTPYIKQYQEEREMTVYFLIDISSSMLFGSTSQAKLDLLVEVVACIAYSAVCNNDKIALILFDSEVRKFLPPKRGSRHFLRVLREIYTCQDVLKTTDLSKALSFFSKIQKKSCIAFLISDFFSPNFSKGFRALTHRHDLSSICLYDPAELHFPHLGLMELNDLETGEILLVDGKDRRFRKGVEEDMLASLDSWKAFFKKNSVPFLSLSSQEDVSKSLIHFFSKHQMGR